MIYAHEWSSRGTHDSGRGAEGKIRWQSGSRSRITGGARVKKSSVFILLNFFAKLYAAVSRPFLVETRRNLRGKHRTSKLDFFRVSRRHGQLGLSPSLPGKCLTAGDGRSWTGLLQLHVDSMQSLFDHIPVQTEAREGHH